MSAAARVICLEISGSEKEGRTRFTYRVRVDDEVVLANQQLTKQQANEVVAIGDTYASLFEQQTPEKVGSAQLEAIGSRLFELWLQPWWGTLAQAPAGARQRLVIASLRSDVLNLPWELLVPPGRNHVGIDTGWGVCRVPASECRLSDESYLEAGPLRVLFLTASPRDQDELNYEREEEFLLSAIQGAFVEVGDLGTFEELKDRLDASRPHVVHLSGHGTIGDHGAAFIFEDEKGLSNPQPAAQLGRLFSGSGVRCVFVSGCVSGQAPPREILGGICQSLVAHGVPMAVGWAAAILDEVATQVAKSFYGTLAKGQPVDFALARARSTARGGGSVRGDPSWSLPLLYATVRDQRVYDNDMAPRGEPAPSRLQQPLPGMTAGYARQFTGRRRELQAILPDLRDDERKGVVITGMGGTGKSSLATRLARKLEADSGLELVVVPCRPNMPTRPEQLSNALRVAFAGSAKASAWNKALADAGDNGERLQILVKVLNEGRFVLVWDNFENNLDLSTRRFLNADMEYFYNELLCGLVGASRVIITSRYLPADFVLPDTFAALNLGEFSQTSYFKFLVRDDQVRRLYLTKKLPRSMLLELRRRFGSAPKFVQQMRGLLPGLDAENLAAEIKNPARTQETSQPQASSALRNMHEQYCEGLKVSQLYGDLPAESRVMLSRLAVFAGPVTAEVIERVGESSLQQVTAEIVRWRASALVHAEPEAIEKVWSVYGTLRAWLMEPSRLPAQTREAAHKSAAEVLLDVANGLSDDGRHSELQLGKAECFQLARSHYLAIDDGTSAFQVTERLNQILLRESRYADLVNLNEELLEYTSHPGPATWAARAYLEQGKYEKAREFYTEALKRAKNLHPMECAQALQGLATLAMRNHDNTEARTLLDQALAIQRTISDRKGEGVSWHQLGSIDFNEMNYAGAREKFTTALTLLTDADTAEEQQATQHQLGSIEFEEGCFDAAKVMLTKALRIAQCLKDKKAIAVAIHQLGRVEAKIRKDPHAGLPMLREALDLRRKIGDGIGEAQSFRRMSELTREGGQPDLALKLMIVSHYLYKTLRDGNAKLVRDSVAKQAAQIGHNAEQLRVLMTEVEDAYLRDRGKALLREIPSGGA
jgi:tetratricopeptide (TPR) repeat protein